MSGLKSISPSGSAEHVSGESEVTDGDKRYVKIICNILFATNFIQLAAGAYAFSLVTGQYQTHRGSFWAAIFPVVLFVFCHCFWKQYGDTDKIIGVSVLSIILSIAGAAVDAGFAGKSFGWCSGPTNYGIWWVNGNKNDLAQAVGLAYCFNKDFEQYNKDSAVTVEEYKPPANVCVCNVELTSSSKSLECFPRFEMTGANSCAKLDAYSPILGYTTGSNVLTIILCSAVVYLCWGIKRGKALAAAGANPA